MQCKNASNEHNFIEIRSEEGVLITTWIILLSSELQTYLKVDLTFWLT